MRKQVKITVSGVTASGKTTIAAMIAKSLKMNGFNHVDVNFLDQSTDDVFGDVDTLSRKLKAVTEQDPSIMIVE